MQKLERPHELFHHDELGGKMGAGNVDGNMHEEEAYDHAGVVLDEDTYTLRLQEAHSDDDPADVGVDGMDILQHLVSVGKLAEQTEDVVDDVHIVVVVEVEEDVLMLLDYTVQAATDSEM
jgi:hypothetical protein